jgi:hypothetical protein
MAQIESIFFYRSFLCWCDRRGGFKVQCLDYHYVYTGQGGRQAAKAKIDYFLELRQEKIDRRQQP